MYADDNQSYSHSSPNNILQIAHEFVEATELFCLGRTQIIFYLILPKLNSSGLAFEANSQISAICLCSLPLP